MSSKSYHSVSIIPFHGFYESIHSDALEHQQTMVLQNEEGDDVAPEEFHDAFHFTPKMLESYCRAYVLELRDYLDQEKGLFLPSMTFEKMTSPREYNFETDRIFVAIDEEDAQKIIDQASREDLKEVVEDLFEPRSGFVPFYDNDVESWINKTPDTMDSNEMGAYLMASAEGGWDDQEVLDHDTTFHEKVSRIVEAHMPSECKKIVDNLNEKGLGPEGP